MSNRPKVSVIIPSYNYAHKLKAAVDSVLNQSIDDVEVIIVNDCSTDNTHELAISIKDNRVVYILNKKNLGVNKTVNIGFNNAKGRYLCVLAADDVLPPDSIKIRVETLEKNNYDAVHGGTTIVKYGVKSYISPLDTGTVMNIVSFLQDGSSTHGINNASFMYNRRIFDIIGYRDESKQYFPHNDFEFALRTLLNCNVGYVEYPVYIYEIHPFSHSEIHAKNTIAEQKQKKLKNKYLTHFKNKS